MEPLKSVSSFVEKIPDASVKAKATGAGALPPPPPPPPQDTNKNIRNRRKFFIQKIIT
jgi:hypothetical protein